MALFCVAGTMCLAASCQTSATSVPVPAASSTTRLAFEAPVEAASSQSPVAATVADRTFADAAISIRFPKDWPVSTPVLFPNSDVQEEGVTIQKGNFFVSAKGETILQASGVDGGRLYEYLRSGVVNVACLWQEGASQTLQTEANKLPNGITVTDYYLDAASLSSDAKDCLTSQAPASGDIYVGSSSGLMGEPNYKQTLIRFYGVAGIAYLKGDTRFWCRLCGK